MVMVVHRVEGNERLSMTVTGVRLCIDIRCETGLETDHV